MSVKKKAILTTLGVLALIVLGGLLVPRNQKEQPSKVYAFSELGAQCSAASTDYQSKAVALTSQLEKDKALLNAELAKTQADIYSDADSIVTSTNRVRGDYLAAYNAGYMTSEDYKDKVAGLDHVGASYGTPSPSAQAELKRIQLEADKYYDEVKKQAADMQAAAMRMQSCAGSAEAQLNFTPSDIADIEVLIAGSK